MDAKFMGRALEIAAKGSGYTNPNPLVGAVIVKEGRIIGEGYHEVYGGNHAEVNAINNAVEDVKGSTMYVTLEPCSHYGKTPPCAKALVEKGIKKVVIGLKDPNPLVSGKGIEILKSNGIEVVVGVLEDQGKKLNEIFLKYITTKTPFCVMKTAMTLDGKIAATTGDSKWITGEISRKYVHNLRHKLSGIMIGVGTVIADDPLLTTRVDFIGGKDPTRIIIDSSGRMPLEAKVLNLKSNAKTIIATTEKAHKDKIRALEEKGAEIIITSIKNNGVDLRELMKKIGEMNIDSILLEGGSKINYSALEAGIVDKVNAFISPKIVGGDTAKTPVGGEGKKYMKDAILLKDTEIHHFGDDIMVEGYVIRGNG